LLVPPIKQEGDTFYPQELKKYHEYEDYFNKHLLKQEWKKRYMYRGDLRPSEALDSVCRGGLANDDHLYKPNPAAGESMHAKVGWKNLLAKNDLLAQADPKIVKQMEEVKEAFHKKAAWIEMQKRNMAFQNDRWEHLVYVLRQEIGYEHARQSRLLRAEKRQHVDEMLKILQERFTSVDRLMDTLAKYNMYGGLDESDFLVYCLEQWRKRCEESRLSLANTSTTGGEGKKSNKNKTAKKIGDNVSPYEYEISVYEKKYRKKKQQHPTTGSPPPSRSKSSLAAAASKTSTVSVDDADTDDMGGQLKDHSTLDTKSMTSKSAYSITSRRKAMLENMEGGAPSVDRQVVLAKGESERHFKSLKEKRLKDRERRGGGQEGVCCPSHSPSE